ncbi:5'/3'-nucleotidase SurE [Vibrio stylophorae]|uniref:5'-nucleotidase SurE n=1 Tax=Vibrio stylophorae TaxID=659351 RepID=A0ABM8ZVI3_9VIBR|nr:5'/3'-nucleotidase SurE [Vibrio stylophorae]CAH0534349.1 5'/3'-nucleotidase SurE [Vibrio stylophorae]
MHILLSNDDGIFAEGLQTLAQTIETHPLVSRVTVVAPDRNRSGASNSLTLDQPLRVRQVALNQYAVEGTPTDCVHFALNELLLSSPPDLVLTGINHGANQGEDVLYSGTVAAATEGFFLQCPAIALSLVGKHHFDTAAAIASQLVTRWLQNPQALKQVLNVNVPDLPLAQIQGMQVTRLGARHRAEPMVKQLDPRGHTVYWLGPPGGRQDAGEGTDFYAVDQGWVSITPLDLDLTAHQAMANVRQWLD